MHVHVYNIITDSTCVGWLAGHQSNVHSQYKIHVVEVCYSKPLNCTQATIAATSLTQARGLIRLYHQPCSDFPPFFPPPCLYWSQVGLH